MIRFRNLILLTVAVLLALCLVACGGSKVDSIRFDKTPRTVYVQGQELDLANTTVTVVKGDKTEQISASELSVSGYEKDTLGKQTVTFTYHEVSTTLDVTVIPRIEVEGAIRDYFVGDTFDQSKGRIRVANDKGEVSTVALNDSGVKVSGFDSSKAGSNVSVTIEYAGYTGKVSVNVYDVESVELSAYPSNTEYGSHETVFDVTGAYFTVKAKGVDFERFVELNASMIKNFNPSAATIENLTQALKQTVTISYLGYDFDMEISIKFSGVSLVQLRAKELASITDFDNIPKDKGELALDAMRAYIALDNTDKAFVGEDDKNTVAKIAVIYGYARFLEEKDKFSETLALSPVKQDGGEVIGMFSIVASGYETTVRDLEILKKSDTPMIVLGELLQSIRGRFGNLEIVDSKTVKEYLELVYTVDGLSAATDILSLMVDLYDELKVVDTDWDVKDLVAYKSNIKTAVVTVTGSEFNPFQAPPYIEVFHLLSKWREKNDYFDIIYAYYMEYEPNSVIDALWQNVPMPEKLQNIYTMLINAAQMTSSINIGGDLSEFYYYYKIALENEKEILNGDNQLHIDIYNKFKLGSFIKSYIFVGDNMNNIGYIYYVSSMVDNENFAEIIDKYLEIVWGEFATSEFTDEELHAAVRELLGLYAELSPAERYAFICAIHCDYRYNAFTGYLFESYLNDDGEVKANNRFVYLLSKTYLEMVSEDAWDVFTRLITASEVQALIFRDAGKADEFKAMMKEILEDAAKLSAKDREAFGSILDEMTLLYNECITPSQPSEGTHIGKIDEILSVMNKFFDVSYAMNDSSLTATEKSNIANLWVALAEKAKALEKEILASGDEALINTYLHCKYTFDTARGGDDGEDIQTTINFMMDEIRASQINMLVTTTLNDPRNSNDRYNAYSLFNDYGLKEFLVSAVDVMYASYANTADKLDREHVFEVLGSIREMSKNTMFTFMMFNTNAYFYDGVYDCLSANCDETIKDMILGLLSAEEQYIIYTSISAEDNRAQFCSKMEALKDKYDALENKAAFGDFLEMYNYYLKMYISLKNS